jgi:hypothetical protein
MQSLSLLSQISLYVLLALIGLFSLLLWGWQIMILKGKAIRNPDGSSDGWQEQKSHYGMVVADVFLACPASIMGIILVSASPRWGFYLLVMVNFWFVWANIMTTAQHSDWDASSREDEHCFSDGFGGNGRYHNNHSNFRFAFSLIEVRDE